MNEIEVQAIISTLEAQRNQALTQVVTTVGKLTVAEAKIKELIEKLPKGNVDASETSAE